MASYQHINLMERAKIKTLQQQGLSIRDIGKCMGRSHTTISRELRRNNHVLPSMVGYVPELADRAAQKRHSKASHHLRLKTQEIRSKVNEKLSIGWTPEQIAATIGEYIPGATLSHEAIYQYIYADYRDGIVFLPRSHRERYPRKYSKKSRAGKLKNRVDIDERPEEINQRKVFGHWESDSIVSRSGKSAINVMLERISRKVIINKVSDKTAAATKSAIISSLNELPAASRISITYDNGSENYYHEEINTELNMQSYFCKPYHSWEKGGVENMNGLIRRYIPKKTNLDTVTEEFLALIEKQINSRPRKCLNFKTANEVFAMHCKNLQ